MYIGDNWFTYQRRGERNKQGAAVIVIVRRREAITWGNNRLGRWGTPKILMWNRNFPFPHPNGSSVTINLGVFVKLTILFRSHDNISIINHTQRANARRD